ncbi:sodium channel protein Nach [Anoplophora glabripennis]|uniref:sodium channel protein Nach n=1 Tax=Anoplophora glabripennis TaxID=217634 RepID=UPI000C778083|nr:sodium channel protein Nach [Anoplophora glabripennis]
MTRRKSKTVPSNYQMLKTSWGVQGKLFFENSTLHGVRYIAEDGRPFIEKLMWSICVVVGTVAAIVVILSLWEKFQTNPTITGLDTDFHNWEVPFPAITVCLQVPTTTEKIENYISQILGRRAEKLPGFNMKYIKETDKEWSMQFHFRSLDNLYPLMNTCDEVFQECYWKLDAYNCCDGFFPVFTENGFCYTFNSRHYERKIPGLPLVGICSKSLTTTIYVFGITETNSGSSLGIYILNSDEVAGIDMQPQHVWSGVVDMISLSVKQTYTTPDARQLSIKQRHCAFPDEIKLKVDDVYSYSACTRQCRMDTAMKLCGCIPFFYPMLDSYKYCTLAKMTCIGQHLEEIKSVEKCSCVLSCSNAVYAVERLDGITSNNAVAKKVNCEFASWPMVRYKREVLFGWVDLLVSFGGIAGLFLGFSLLSGVEILYYFTVRACCMVVRERNELRRIQVERAARPPPSYDLSLVPYFISAPLPGNGIDEVAKSLYVGNLLRYSNDREGNGSKQAVLASSLIAPFGIEFTN